MQEAGSEETSAYPCSVPGNPAPLTEGASRDDIGQRHDQHIGVNVLQQTLTAPLTAHSNTRLCRAISKKKQME